MWTEIIGWNIANTSRKTEFLLGPCSTFSNAGVAGKVLSLPNVHVSEESWSVIVSCFIW